MLAVRGFIRQKDRMYVVRVGHTASCHRWQRRLREGATTMHATLQQVCAQLQQAAPRFFAQHIRSAATEACEQAAALLAALTALHSHGVESDLEQEEQWCGVNEGELVEGAPRDGEHPVERVVTLYTEAAHGVSVPEREVTLYTRPTVKAWPCEMVPAATAARRAQDSVMALQRALDNAAMQSTVRDGETLKPSISRWRWARLLNCENPKLGVG
jgi:hypothetical protein